MALGSSRDLERYSQRFGQGMGFNFRSVARKAGRAAARPALRAARGQMLRMQMAGMHGMGWNPFKAAKKAVTSVGHAATAVTHVVPSPLRNIVKKVAWDYNPYVLAGKGAIRATEAVGHGAAVAGRAVGHTAAAVGRAVGHGVASVGRAVGHGVASVARGASDLLSAVTSGDDVEKSGGALTAADEGLILGIPKKTAMYVGAGIAVGAAVLLMPKRKRK
jgi:hypothetical protein